MISVSRELSFGITVHERRSRCWRVRSGAEKPELFIEREGLQRAMHVSLHQSGNWHVKFGRKPVVQWSRPPEIVLGFTRAVCIVQPVSVTAATSLAAPDGAILLPVTADADPVHFDVVLERPGANLAGWPGKNAMGTTLIGRIGLAGGVGTCCVVARATPMVAGSMELPRPSDAEVEHMRQAMERGDLYGTFFAEQDDGAMALIDCRFEVAAPLVPDGS